jgi:hypothetical protein
MRRAWAELRAPISALVLLGLLLRVMAPMPLQAAAGQAAFDAMLRATLCLPSGLPAPDAPEQTPDAEAASHCPLCRLPDAADAPPPAPPVLPMPAWTTTAAPRAAFAGASPLPPARASPPARAPPAAPTLG